MNEQDVARARLRSLDAGMVSGSWWRRMRRFALFVVVMIALVELAGVPGLRWTYQKQGNRIVMAEYVGPAGRRRMNAGAFGGTCPLIVMVPLERSLLSYAGELFSRG